MTGKERLINAINGKATDRVPVTLFIQGQGHYINQIKPNTDPWDFVSLQKDVVDYQKSLGVDVHVRMLFFNPHEPVYVGRGMLNIDVENDNWKINKSIKEDGSEKFYNYEIVTPEGKLTQTLCIVEQRPGTYVYATTKNQYNLLAI